MKILNLCKEHKNKQDDVFLGMFSYKTIKKCGSVSVCICAITFTQRRKSWSCEKLNHVILLLYCDSVIDTGENIVKRSCYS